MRLMKKTAKKTTHPKHASVKRVSTTTSTDTKLIVVILLLLLTYPIGLLFMWAWMKTWRTWVKVLITIPLLLTILAFILGILLVGAAVKRGIQYEEQKQHIDQQQLQKDVNNGSQNQFYLSPTPDTNGSY